MKRILLVLMVSVMGFTSSWAQKTVTGTVTSEEDRTPVPGVNVIVKGTTIGTVTDIDGKYMINVPGPDAILVFSFIGLATEEVKVGNQSVIDMVMTADIHQLTEVVVTAVGIEANKAELGYSIESVKAEELVNARETNLVEALSSKAAGVLVTGSSGSPGASASIRIRGSKSVNGSNQPLFVVDGVPIDNSGGVNGVAGVDNSNRAIDINPNDIASLTVLKGPAATVLYGIRAANGAIIITTKKGKKGFKVDFGYAATLSQVNKLPEQQSTYAQGRPSSGVPIWRGPHTREGFSWGPKISELEYDGSEYPYDKNGMLVPKGTGNGIPARAYDNADNFFVNGVTNDANLSISGGTDKVNYYVSSGYLTQTGVVPKADFDRWTFLTKVSANILDNLEVGMQANYINSGGHRIQRGSNISGVMLGLMRNTPTFDAANGYTNGRDAANDPSVYMLPDGTQRSYRAGVYDSPFWTVNKNPYQDDVNRIIGNTYIKWDIASWLTASYKIGLDYYHRRVISAMDINSADTKEGKVNQYDLDSRDINSDFLLMFNKDFGKVGLNAVLGHNWYSTQGISRSATGNKLGAPDFYHISNATDVQASEGIGRKQIFGVYADVKLSWDNWLFLNLSARNDWSSALPKENNSFFYPAFSLGWAITDMLDIQNTYVKVRASWGQVGNDAPIYATANYFGAAHSGGDGFTDGISFPAYGVNAFERNFTLGNQNLRAELTSTLEFGAEFQFFKGRLGFDITYYDSQTEDQVLNVDLAPSTGFGAATSNAGLISNKGWELMLNARIIEAGDFAWDLSANWTRYRSMVERLAESVGKGGIGLNGFVSASARVIEGQPYSVIYGNQYQHTEDGKLIIGNDGWPLADTEQGVLGDPNPDWFAGIRNTLSWKGISVSALLDIRQGGDIWNGTWGVMSYFGMSKETETDRDIKGYVFDGVVNTGTEENPVYEKNTTPVDFANPALGLGSYKWLRYGFGWTEDNIEDASWVRLRELTVTYSFPASLLERSPLSYASISFTGRNLWLATKYQGIDPEANLTGTSNGFGLEYFGMPNTKSYGLALKVTF